jgi:FkbM family methyltransferase
MKTVPIRYFGHTVSLPDLPRYRKFYRKLAAEDWEPRTFRTLRSSLDAGTVYIDIGGWIGVTALWASHLAKRVIIIEPDPECRAILAELCPGYANVALLEGAFSPTPSVIISAAEGFGSSETTALALGPGDSLEVRGISVNEIMHHIAGEPIFIKIDIEGYELRIADEIARFADYHLKGIQCAVHPALYERSLGTDRLTGRARALLATARLARMHRALSARPSSTKYRAMFSYLVFGVLFRAAPKGTDLIFTPRAETS